MKDLNGNLFKPPKFKYSIKDALKYSLGAVGLEKSELIPGEFDKVLFFILDGFGYRLMNDLGVLDSLKSMRFEEFSSVVPSVTPSALSSIFTGVDVAEHGVMGVKFWLPETGQPFTPLGFVDLASGMPSDLPLEALLLEEPISKKLKEQDHITPWAILPSSIEGKFAGALHAGSKAYFVDGFAGMHYGLSKFLHSKAQVGVAYLENPDWLFHKGYPGKSIKAELEMVFHLIDLLKKERGAKKTCLIFMGDHGEVKISQDVDFLELRPLLNLDALGSSRSRILHTRPQYHDLIVEALKDYFVLDSRKLLKSSLLGKAKDESFERAGDLWVFPRGDESLNFGKESLAYNHGSILEEEMSAAFGFGRLSEFSHQ